MNERGSVVSMFTDDAILSMWVEGSGGFDSHGPELGICKRMSSLDRVASHTRVRPVPVDAVEVTHEVSTQHVLGATHVKCVCSCGAETNAYPLPPGVLWSHRENGWVPAGDATTADIALEGRLFGIHDPNRFHHEENLPEPTFDCPSCRDTGRRTYHDGKERDCGACGDGPCVECDKAGFVAFACEHTGNSREVQVTRLGWSYGNYTFSLSPHGGKSVHEATCLFTARPQLSVPLDNQAELAELLCPDA